MDLINTNKDWHALFVMTGDEDNIKERLKYRFSDKYDIFVPKRKLRERKGGIWSCSIRVLFPGYVLLKGNISIDSYYRLKNIPGLIRVLKCGNDILTINEQEIQVLSKLICNGDTIGISDLFLENGQVRVIDGPLMYMEGSILSVNQRKGRARVLLNFLGEERIVELGVSVLRSA